MLGMLIAFSLGGSAGFVLGCLWIALFTRRGDEDALTREGRV